MEAVAEYPLRVANERWIYVAFVAWAILSGAVTGYVSGPFVYAVNLQVFAGQALCDATAAVVLFAVGKTQRQKMLDAGQWKAVLLLLIPQWCSVPIGLLNGAHRWLRGVGWGAGLLLMVAAPLWLGLLSALGLTQAKVPRAVAGAAIAGVFAVCLVVPVQAYSVAWSQAAILTIRILLNLAVVASWGYAAPRLISAGGCIAASGYLILGAAGDGVFALLFRRTAWQPLDWGTAWEPLLLNTALTASAWLLWFWLLRRMTLAAFSMQSLAAWAPALMLGLFNLGWANWRMAAALAIAVGAIVIALRARVADEQPVALGLGGTETLY
jgi:hypothetical protein